MKSAAQPAKTISVNSGNRSHPQISIGLPVFNGEKYLRETLDSLLSQSLGDFELIIADNGSTDSTPELCAEFANKDPRIRYIRHPTNMGGPRNWNFVVTQANGPFFKWASANDLHDPRYLEKCLNILRTREDLVLCYSSTTLIDESGAAIEIYDEAVDLMETDPMARFRSYIFHYRYKLNNAHAGVMRTDVLRQTRLIGNYPNGDIPLMAELSIRGKFFRVSEPLFFRRMGPETATPKKDELANSQFVDPSTRSPLVWSWRQCLDLLRVSLRAPATQGDRFRGLAIVLHSMRWRRAELGRELLQIFGRRMPWSTTE